MLITFQDMYEEEFLAHGKIGLTFWISIVFDVLKSSIEQHYYMVKKQGIKKYFHINIFNIIGGMLLIPFLILLGIDFFGRLIQGDFTHYNRTVNNWISHTIIYSSYHDQAPILWILLVLFPILAIVLNFIPLILSIENSKKLTVKKLIFANPVTIVFMSLSIFCLLIVFGHDVVPCIAHFTLRNGIGNIVNTVNYCRVHA